MSYARCPEQRECVARLLALLAWLKGVSDLPNRVNFYSVLYRPNDVFPFAASLHHWGRDCYFERRMRTSCCPVSAGRHNVEMSAVPATGRSPRKALAEWRSGYECRS